MSPLLFAHPAEERHSVSKVFKQKLISGLT